jgi:hypothetical protein
MRTLLFACVLALGLTACSDSSKTNVTAPPPEDSQMGDGRGLKKEKLAGEKEVGGRQIPGVKGK